MDTVMFKEAGKWMMTAGAVSFTGGLGLVIAMDIIDKKAIKLEHNKTMASIKENETKKTEETKRVAMLAKAKADELYSAKLEKMDNKEFARHHAEMIAEANEEVKANAARDIAEIRAQMVELQLACDEKINATKAECLKKIEAANSKRDEAVRKFETINDLFVNKDKVLKAKAALEEAAEAEKKSQKEREEALKTLKIMTF